MLGVFLLRQFRYFYRMSFKSNIFFLQEGVLINLPTQLAGLHNLCHLTIRDGSTWSKFGAHGEHGDVFLFSNLGALWFSEKLIRYSFTRAQFSVPPLHREQLNKYLNFQHDQEDFDFVCFLFTKRPNAGSSRLKEESIALVLSEGAHIPRWQT